MMDEQLRDNVERLIKDRAAAPTSEFLARLNAQLHRSAAPARWNVFSFVAAAALLAALVTLFVRESPPVRTGFIGAIQEESGFGDVLLDVRSAEFESFFLREGIAVAAELVEIGKSPGVYCGIVMTSQKTTWKIGANLVGTMNAATIGINYLIVGGSRYLRGAELNPAVYQKGARRIFLLAPPPQGAAPLLDVEEGGEFLDIPDSDAVRKALQAIAARAADGRKRLAGIVAQLQKAVIADAVERGDILDSLAKEGGRLLPLLYAIHRSAASTDVRSAAWSLALRIQWDGHADLQDRLADFVKNNGYAMLRPVNSQMATGRKAIDLAHDCLRLAPRAAIAWLVGQLDNESLAGEKAMPLVCQNALCLLNEITDFSYEGMHIGGTPATREHNDRVRQKWKSWWATMRVKPEAEWCFGLSALEKAGLKRLWLPPIGPVETSPLPEPVLTEDDLAFAKKLGKRAVPFLLHSLCVDPPRYTLWETGTVEWNPTALKLIEGISGQNFGVFDTTREARKLEGRNKELLDGAKAWWTSASK